MNPERVRDADGPSWLAPTWTPRTGGDAPTLAQAGESGVLAAIMPHLARADAEIGPGDDAAVLPRRDGRVVVTTDSMVLGLDWCDDWSSAFDVGVKVIAQNLADVEAMGAHPSGVVVALAAEPSTRVDWLVDLTRGMADELRRAGCGSFGGDLSGAPHGTVVVTVTALGILAPDAPVLRRSGVRVGDVLVVSDRLGRSHAGLLMLAGEVRVEESDAARECVTFHRAPRPRFVGAAAASVLHAAMDVSDGLGRDAARLAEASAVRLELESRALAAMAEPLSPVVGTRALECVLASGEEHALLGACAPDAVPPGWTVIGTAQPGEGVWLGDRRVDDEGWSHYGGA